MVETLSKSVGWATKQKMACDSSTTTDHEAGRILERGKAGEGFHRGKKLYQDSWIQVAGNNSN